MATDAKLAALATGQKLARFRRELPLALCSRPRDECGLCLLKQGLKDQEHLFYKMASGIGTILERIASSVRSLVRCHSHHPIFRFRIVLEPG